MTTPRFCGGDTTEVSYEEAKPYSSVPSPLSLPLIGNTYLLAMKHESGVPYAKQASLLHHDLTQKLGPIYKINLLGIKQLMLSDPEDIGNVVRNGVAEFPKVPLISNIFGAYKKMAKDLYPTNRGMAGIDGPEWWKSRAVFNKYTGRPGALYTYIPGLEEIADDFVKLCNDHILDENNDTPDNFIKELRPWGLECINYLFLGSRLGELTAEALNDKSRDSYKIIESLDQMLYNEFGKLIVTSFWKKYPYLSPPFKRFDNHYRTIHGIARRLYRIKEEELANMKAENIDWEDSGILTSLIQECRLNPDLEGMPLSVFVESMAAGHDTASTVAGYFLYHMALNPDKQEIAYEEIMRKIGDKPITRKDLNRLKFFRACSKESQRLNPPFLGLPREIQNPIVIRGYQIPAGTSVILNQVTLNQMHVPNPNQFVPERWLRGSNHPLEKSVPNFGHLVFGYGRRQCPGKRVVTTYMDVLMIKMLKEFRLEYHEQPIEADFKEIGAGSLIQSPDLLKIRLIKRNK